MKKKILAIFSILLLVTIPFGIGGASELQLNQETDEPASLEIAVFDEYDTITTETLTISQEDLITIEETISILMDKIESAESWEEIENILNNFQLNGIIGSIIGKLLSKLNIFRTRGFVVSSGHFYKLNPFKKTEIDIKKGFAFWHYSSGSMFKDRTIILIPLQFKMKILTGTQFGFMYKFFGIYLFLSSKLPNKSYSFFIGTAKRINGIQLHK